MKDDSSEKLLRTCTLSPRQQSNLSNEVRFIAQYRDLLRNIYKRTTEGIGRSL